MPSKELRVHNIKNIRDLSNYTYIGRGTIFGNPFILNRSGTRDVVINKFREYALNNPTLLYEISNIDKDLVCHCSPSKCHGDVILDIKKKLELGEITIPSESILAVIGSRTFTDYDKFKIELTNFLENFPHRVGILVSGGAKGADSLARRYSEENNLPFIEIPADWNKYGMSAGMIRNQEVILKAHYVLAFWDGTSTGTLDAISRAKMFNKPCTTIRI